MPSTDFFLHALMEFLFTTFKNTGRLMLASLHIFSRSKKKSGYCSLNNLKKNYRLACGAFAFSCTLSSCTKVIDIGLNDADKKYVIEGIVTDQQGTCMVKITQSANFSSANNFPVVTGATVTVKDGNGTPVTLIETIAGTYQSAALSGVSGHTYTLSVTINGKLFNAVSAMPQRVNLDSLYIQELTGFGNSTKYANILFRDPPGKGNAYRFIQYKNNRQNKSIFILNDDFSDGRVITTFLADFGNDDDADKIESGNTVRVELQCVDAAIYKYWYGLEQGGTGSSNNATPGNPVSNISGGALGYFSAHTVQFKTVIAP